jgi:polyphosphate:AMP phosphotransferase
MHRYWISMPRQGHISLFIGSWYHDLCAMLVKGKHPKRSARRQEQICLMEQMLLRDGAVIEKFFLDVPAKVQKKRLKELCSRKETRHTVTKADLSQNRRYDSWQQAYRQVMDETNLPGSEWHVLNGEEKKAAKQAMYETVIAAMENAIALRQTGDRSWDTDILTDHEPIPTEPIPELELYETDLVLDREYKAAISAAQKKLHKLQYELNSKGIPVVLAFEGWDAAGKGGSIRRLTNGLDPRGCTVIPVASPTAEEKEHHHLWRFWKNLPKNGDICVFDRTWYGRAMVERLEGFCTEAQWKRSYEEMNLFEQELTEAGAVVCKFWLHISPDEQLKRFNRRAANPEKQWKITDEDWRNREKWSLYDEAVNDMLKKTNTAYAPWTVVEADSKHYARVKVLETVIAAIEKRLEAE